MISKFIDEMKKAGMYAIVADEAKTGHTEQNNYDTGTLRKGDIY